MESRTVIAGRYDLQSVIESGLSVGSVWRAWDSRLASSVLLLLAEDRGRDRLLEHAERARSLRHVRLTRVLDLGSTEIADTAESGEVAFTVLEEPLGIRVDELLVRSILPVPVARVLLGEALRTMSAAADLGLVHGALSPGMLTVTDRGRVLVAGAGVFPALISPDTATRPVTERDDARALALLFVEAITGKSPQDVSPDDLPRGLTPAERDLSVVVLSPSGRPSLSDLHRVFPPRSTRLLTEYSSRRPSFCRRAPVSVPLPVEETELDQAESIASVGTGAAELSPWDLDLLEEGWGLDGFEEVAVEEVPTVVEALLGALHRRFPSWKLGRRLYERARDHALTGPKFDATPWLLLGGLVIIAIVGFLSLQWARGPFTPTVDLNNPPSQEYPPYTFDPTASSPTP